MGGDHRAGNHGLARAWRRDQYTEVMVAQIIHSALLLAGQRGGECELPRLVGMPFVGDLKAATGLLDQRGHRVLQAPRQDEPPSRVSS